MIKKLTTPVLIVLIAISFSYGYKKNNENTKLKSELKKSIKEKENIQEQISLLTNNYEKINNKNKKLSKRFISEINKIIRLKDSVNELDNDLKELDINLKTDKKVLSKKTLLAKNLANKNKDLVKQIREAMLLKISSIDISKMKKKINGKYIKTTKNTKIDAFKIDVQIEQNELANSGEKKFHLQLINPENEIISIYKRVKINNKTLICSNEILFNYEKEQIDLTSVIKVDRDNLKTGKYIVNAFIGGKLISKTNFHLE